MEIKSIKPRAAQSIVVEFDLVMSWLKPENRITVEQLPAETIKYLLILKSKGALHSFFVELEANSENVSTYLLGHYDNFTEFIKGAFIWASTSRGQSYWYEISKYETG